MDNLARELSAIGNVRMMVDALNHLQGKQERARSGEIERAQASDSESEMGPQGRQV